MKLSTAKITLNLALICFTFNSYSQEKTSKPYNKTQVFVSIGVSKPTLSEGEELLRSKKLRDQHLSYFENSSGDRKNVGSYADLFGWNIGLGFYKPIRSVERLMWGSEINLSLTGSTPSDGNEEAYYFNYISFNFGLKYYPLPTTNLFLKGNFGIGNVMTKNRFINEEGGQNFQHFFGLGLNGTAAIGYSFPLKTKILSAIEASAEYKLSNPRVEVNGIGNDNWQHSSLDFRLAFIF
ncbi:hypothetical protein SAMN04489761_4156 [Tenacibaculum sp. MAR_2009_124]|uniref:hypothetical protein n=1 Tax=Tenacibaculum sp. MAR_2009_124 TaxID=1250059 RepID=UPI000899782C|nr:hypothetical protein [Tenacibaculum sp. MAR_2009_124]SED06509.1 hypothetical protein SAMN04489761_4156 [Tenacibaculum sp. MAR_2009_124]